MAITTYLERLQRIDQLIRLKATGTPRELANKLGVSKRTVYEYIQTLKDMDAPICYCKVSRSYVYEEPGRFEINFKKK